MHPSQVCSGLAGTDTTITFESLLSFLCNFIQMTEAQEHQSEGYAYLFQLFLA
jgi:hypothetical protein